MDVGELSGLAPAAPDDYVRSPITTVDQEIPPVDRDLRAGWRWTGIGVVTACCVVVLLQLHVSLILRNTTANGGDLGAHVWFPAYLRDHLLPQLRVAGWTNDWFGGFPAGQFYFPLPALLVVLLNVALPYNIAFKIVSASGIVALPAASYALGRGLGVRRPTPELFAVATTIFVFFKGIGAVPGTADATIQFNQRIMGGTGVSTMAGEYSFAVALALALFFLGALAFSVRTRRRLWLPAVLLAAVALSHVIVAIFAAVGGVIVVAFALGRTWSRNRRVLGAGIAIGLVAFLLTAFWSLPLVDNFGLTANMRYEKLVQYHAYMLPGEFTWVFLLAAIGLVVAFVRFDRGVLAIASLTLVFALFFRFWPELHVWNLRFLPFWYLGAFLVAASAVGAGARLAAQWAATLASGATVQTQLDTSAASREERDVAERRSYRVTTTCIAVGITLILATAGLWYSYATRGFFPDWANWNYTGYQTTSTSVAQPKSYPEYKSLIDTMRKLPPGRALWEGGDSLNIYGTPLALMLLPYWTDGRIASMEGLYYESAASTPYTFMMIASVSGTTDGKSNSSNPVRGLDYRTISDFDLGVRYMQMEGVRYYMAYSDDAKAHADANPNLRLIATVPDLDKRPPLGWKIYELRGHSTVAPLQYEPVVVSHPKAERQSQCFGGIPAQSNENPELGAWECAAARWWNNPDDLNRPFAADGPSSWKRVSQDEVAAAPRRALPKVEVTDVHQGESSISFKVSRTGVPVVVRTSYYPNWEASGAHGPWRLSPNEMVVVPTSKNVSLHYARTSVEWLGFALTVVGLLALGGLVWWGVRRRRKRTGRGEPDLRPPAPQQNEEVEPVEPAIP